MTNIRNALMQAAGSSAGGTEGYVEDFFSTHLYTGTGSTTQSINNGMDLSDTGGLVWLKTRSTAGSNSLYDTVRGVQKVIVSNGTAGHQDDSGGGGTSGLYQFNSNGFSLGDNYGTAANSNNADMVAWTFLKQEGFFDVVTYTGNSTSGHNISHSLGSVPKMMLIKSTSHSGEWFVYHESLGATKFLRLHLTHAEEAYTGAFNDTAPTSSVFTVGNDSAINYTGRTYVAYLFGDEATFGDDGDEAIIKTGTYNGNGSTDVTVDVGFEPQWLMIKRSSGNDPTNDQANSWMIFDNIRGYTATGENQATLFANSSEDEDLNSYRGKLTSTGFIVNDSNVSNSGSTYVYMAIRRGPMKEPTAGTDVYNAVTFTGTGSAADIDSGFPVDLAIPQKRTANQYYNFRDRLRGNKQTLQLPLTSAQFSNASLTCEFDDMNGFHHAGSNIDTGYASNGQSSIAYMFRRYPKVFDVIFYKGTNGGGASSSYVDTYSHNLGVKPEMMILKAVDNTAYALNWQVFHPTALLGSMCNLQDDSAAANGLSDSATSDGVRFRDHSTASVIGRTNSIHTNSSSHSYVGFLFASLSGVSAVNKYTGTGNDINVTDLGAAARFVLIKRVDSSGDWYVFDTARGIVAGNDIYSLWNSTSVEVTNTDYIDPHSSGFTITSSAPDALNASGGTYLYLAFA